MEFDLTISPDYCGDWGRWECFREFIQNCLDGDQAGYPSNIQYTTSGILHIHNKGASLKPEHLVLGVTSKGDGTYRGKFGEGFKVGMIRLCAMARDSGTKESVKVKTGKECWHPCIVHSPKFNTDILRVNVTKCVDNYGLTVSIPNVTPEEWAEIKSRVLALKKSYAKVSTHRGELLLDPNIRDSSLLRVSG